MKPLRIPQIDKTTAVEFQSLLHELRPEWKVWITEDDPVLYELGFVRDIPCTLFIETTFTNIEALCEEITDMEINVYMEEELLYAPWMDLSEKNTLRKKELLSDEQKYCRYSVLQDLVNHVELS